MTSNLSNYLFNQRKISLVVRDNRTHRCNLVNETLRQAEQTLLFLDHRTTKNESDLLDHQMQVAEVNQEPANSQIHKLARTTPR